MLVAAAVGLIWWQQRNLEQLAGAVMDDDGLLHPANPDNIANSAFNGLWQGVTGSDEPFAADMYDLFATGTIYN